MVGSRKLESISVGIGWLSFAACELALGRVMPDRPNLAGAAAELVLMAVAAGLHLSLARLIPRASNPLAPGALMLLVVGMSALASGKLAWRGHPVGVGDLLLACAALFWLGDRVRRSFPVVQPYLAVVAAPVLVLGRYQEIRWFEGGGRMSHLPPVLEAAPWLAAVLALLLVGVWVRQTAVPFLAVLSGLATVFHPRSAAPVPDRPSVVLITVDTLRADDAREMAAYKLLASEGSEFTDAISTAGWTLPAVASLHTGLTPQMHGARRPSPRWPDVNAIDGSRVLMAEAFKQAGYRTAAILSNPYVGPQGGFNQGYDYWAHTPEERPVSLAGLHLLGRRANLELPWDNVDNTAYLIDEAIHWVTHRAEGPFFLWVHVLGPHLPYWDVQLTPDSALYPVLGRYPGRAWTLNDLRTGRIWATPGIQSEMRRLYRLEVEYTDKQVMRLLETLKQEGLFDHTVVALTSDHGEEFWEHGGFEHGHSLYDELVHIPLVFTTPNGPKGAVRSDPASLIDLYPTLAAVAGIERPGDLEGLDLRAPVAPDRTRRMLNDLYWAQLEGIVSGPWKLTRNVANGELALYERSTGERENLAAAQPDVVRQLSGALLGVEAKGNQAPQIDRDMLRSLGYVE